MKKRWLSAGCWFLALLLAVSFAGVGCAPSRSDGPGKDPGGDPPEEPLGDYEYAAPETVPLEDVLSETICLLGGNVAVLSDAYRLEFVGGESGYSLAVVDLSDLSAPTARMTEESVVFRSDSPAEVCVTTNRTLTQVKTASGGYDAVYGGKSGGVVAVKALNFDSGTRFSLYDAVTVDGGGFSVTRTVICEAAADDGAGYRTGFRLAAEHASESYTSCDYVVPANIYGGAAELSASASDDGFVLSQSRVPAGYSLLRVRSTGDSLAIGLTGGGCSTLPSDSGGYGCSRDYRYASVGIERSGTPAVCVYYPCRESGVNTLTRKYAEVAEDNDIQVRFRIVPGQAENISQAMTQASLSVLAAQDLPQAETDSSAVYEQSVLDLNDLLRTEGSRSILPFAAYVESGDSQKWGYTAQSGYIGMQIALGYEMLRYGLAYGDTQSKYNGLRVLDMWAEEAPYQGLTSGVFSGVMTFSGPVRSQAPTLRLLTDGAEGMLDAVRLAESALPAYDVSAWKSLVTGYAEFLVRAQNADGSWYRAYDYDGNMLVAGNRFGIVIDANTIADSKLNTQMPVRFLCRMYEYTGEQKYLTAALRAGEYVEDEVIGEFQYCGGTLDTQGVVDRESGIFAEYAMNALYAVTKDAKWLDLAEQAAAYAMSWTYVIDFAVNNASGLTAGKATALGYTAGMSVISSAGYGADSFMRYLYFDLFRLYLWSQEEAWLSAAQLLQNCTVRNMDLGGAFGYAYRSFMIEATDISSFQFVTAEGTGVWLPWITNANIEPMANMMQAFGCFSVEEALGGHAVSELLALSDAYGAGGGAYGEIGKLR